MLTTGLRASQILTTSCEVDVNSCFTDGENEAVRLMPKDA